MQSNQYKVKFVKENDDESQSVLAVFPDLKDRTYVRGYSHQGQHCNVDSEYYLGLEEANRREFLPLYFELVGLGYKLLVINDNEPSPDPIKKAFSSPTKETRTIVVYQDGCVRLFDQSNTEEDTAKVIVYEPDEFNELSKAYQEIIDGEELYEIQQAIQAP